MSRRLQRCGRFIEISPVVVVVDPCGMRRGAVRGIRQEGDGERPPAEGVKVPRHVHVRQLIFQILEGFQNVVDKGRMVVVVVQIGGGSIPLAPVARRRRRILDLVPLPYRIVHVFRNHPNPPHDHLRHVGDVILLDLLQKLLPLLPDLLHLSLEHLPLFGGDAGRPQPRGELGQSPVLGHLVSGEVGQRPVHHLVVVVILSFPLLFLLFSSFAVRGSRDARGVRGRQRDAPAPARRRPRCRRSRSLLLDHRRRPVRVHLHVRHGNSHPLFVKVSHLGFVQCLHHLFPRGHVDTDVQAGGDRIVRTHLDPFVGGDDLLGPGEANRRAGRAAGEGREGATGQRDEQEEDAGGEEPRRRRRRSTAAAAETEGAILGCHLFLNSRFGSSASSAEGDLFFLPH
mmetsp:Transcript_33976/g.101453  ORF Transcript_33976/g.101453 Transcript_33976/m.101453 type:complete len:398 (-) Transcript_33976:178-1371(-)